MTDAVPAVPYLFFSSGSRAENLSHKSGRCPGYCIFQISVVSRSSAIDCRVRCGVAPPVDSSPQALASGYVWSSGADRRKDRQWAPGSITVTGLVLGVLISFFVS